MRDEHFRVMFINSPLPTLVLNDSRQILDVNAALCEMWGLAQSICWAYHRRIFAE